MGALQNNGVGRVIGALQNNGASQVIGALLNKGGDQMMGAPQDNGGGQLAALEESGQPSKRRKPLFALKTRADFDRYIKLLDSIEANN